MAGATELLHDRNRLSIVSLLAAGQAASLSFKEIQEKAELTAGNLSSHLRTLETGGLVAVTKQFQGRRPLTTVELTDAGRVTLEEFLGEMEEIIRQYRAMGDKDADT